MNRTVTLLLSLAAGLVHAGGPTALRPVRVCDLVRDPPAWRGKDVAVIGRYSYRENGRYMSEEACESRPSANPAAHAGSLRLSLDTKNAPRLPENFDIDTALAGRELKETRKTTALGKFRFGSLEYDRWAIVYGRVEPAGDAAPAKTTKPGLEPAPLVLIYRGDGMIFFISGE